MDKDILTALFLCCLLGLAGCMGKEPVSAVDVEKEAFDDLRSQVKAVVVDPDREAQAIEIIDSLAGSLDDLRTSISQRKRKARDLNADYNATRPQFEQLLSATGADMKANKENVSVKHRALRKAVTSEEWDDLTKASTDAMSAAVKSIQSI